MIGVALKGLAGRKVRALLTAFAVVIGVSMVSGTFILTDTMQKTFDGLFAAIVRRRPTPSSAARRSSRTPSSGSGARSPQPLLAKVRALPEVEAAGGDGLAERGQHAPTSSARTARPSPGRASGVSIDRRQPALQPAQAQDRRLARGPGAGRHRRRHRRQGALEVGDTVKVVDRAGKTRPLRDHRHRLVRRRRLARLRQHRGLGRQDRPDAARTARAASTRSRSPPSEGTSPAELVRAVRPLVPDNLRGQGQRRRRRTRTPRTLDEGMAFIRYFLLGLRRHRAVRRRVRDLQHAVDHGRPAHARVRDAADARRLAQAGHALGRARGPRDRPAGLGDRARRSASGIAKGMVALFSAWASSCPKATTVFAPQHDHRRRWCSGTGITLLASILPARRATRVPPIAAVREGATLPAVAARRALAQRRPRRRRWPRSPRSRRHLRRRPERRRGRAAARRRRARAVRRHRAAGAAARQAAGPRRRLAGAPRRWRRRRAGRRERRPQPRPDGVDRRRADDRAHARHGRRGARRRAAAPRPQAAVTDQVRADYVVDGDEGLPFRAAEGDALARVPGVTAASHVRVRQGARAGRGERRSAASTRPRSRASTRSTWTEGSDAKRSRELGTDGALVTKGYAETQHLDGRRPAVDHDAVGREAHARGPRDLRPAAGQAAARSDQHRPRRRSTRRSRSPKNSYTFLDADASAAAPLEGGGEGLRRRQAAHRRRAIRRTPRKDMATFLAMLYVLLGLLGHREPVRHGQHARALGVRAHPRARDAADDRHDAPPGAPDDPARERHHGADRRRARASASACSSRRWSPRRCRVRRRVLGARADAGRVHAGRGARRHRRGDHARAARLAAQRARRPALRVGARSLAPPPPGGGAARRPCADVLPPGNMNA